MKITRETLLKIIKEEAAAVGGGFTKDMTMAQAAAFADAEEAKERAKEEAAAEKERKAKYANQKYMKNDEVVAILEDIHKSFMRIQDSMTDHKAAGPMRPSDERHGGMDDATQSFRKLADHINYLLKKMKSFEKEKQAGLADGDFVYDDEGLLRYMKYVDVADGGKFK